MFKGAMLLLLAAMTIGLSACTVKIGGSTSQDLAGGVYRSDDFGKSWQQKAAIKVAAGKPQSIADLDVLSLRSDPTDNQALFFGSLNNGLFFSYDAGDSWQKAERLGDRPIAAVAVDYQERCTWYVASGTRIWRSRDCGRFWEHIYADTRAEVLIYSVIVDHYNSEVLYISTSKGEVIKSDDGGANWRTVGRFDDAVGALVMSPFDSRILLAGISDGLFRTTDGGETWQDLKPKFKPFGSLHNFRHLTASTKQPGMWLVASSYGLIKTVNDGEDWTPIDLITPEKKAKINSVVISRQDADKFYYVTDNVFYSTADGGKTWRSLRLPTSRRGWRLVADPTQDGRLYLGAMRWED